MQNTDKTNDGDEVLLFEIYPIWRQKRTGNDDFRFGCFLPATAQELRKSTLDQNDSEAFLLYSMLQQTVVGSDSYQSGPELFTSSSIAETDTIIHLNIGILADPDEPFTSVLHYAKLHNQTDQYFTIISIIAKCGLKLRYRKLTRDLVATSVLNRNTYQGETLPPLYSVDEIGFLKRKFVMEINKHEGLRDFYRHIRDLFLNNSFIEENFFTRILNAGAIIPDIMPVALLAKEN